MNTYKFDSFEEYEKGCKELKMEIVDECPICHTKMRLPEGFVIIGKNKKERMLIAECPNLDCKKIFSVQYSCYGTNYGGEYSYEISGYFPYLAKENIDDEIKEISSGFYNIYCEATKAKELGLNEISGVGYRKALEFLIKDYCIANNPENREDIEKSFLAKVINTYIDNNNIKDMASRAVWIGNDETHYIRRWEGKDINDLLTLIDITCYWISYTEKTKKLKESMS